MLSFCWMAEHVAGAKHKRTVLSIEDKVAIIKQLENSSATLIAERYGIGKRRIVIRASTSSKRCAIWA